MNSTPSEKMLGPPKGFEDQLVPCSYCGRKFREERVGKHENTCKNQKTRKAFDSKSKRTGELPKTGKTSKIKSRMNNIKNMRKSTDKKPDKKKWKREHEDLKKAMKMARIIKRVEEEGGDISKIPVAPSAPRDDYTECKYCYRRFADDVAERHIPKCKNLINRPKPPPHIQKRLDAEKKEKDLEQADKRMRREHRKTLKGGLPPKRPNTKDPGNPYST